MVLRLVSFVLQGFNSNFLMSFLNLFMLKSYPTPKQWTLVMFSPLI